MGSENEEFPKLLDVNALKRYTVDPSMSLIVTALEEGR